MNDWALADLQRRLANLLRIGVVDQLDEGAARVRVRAGDLVTDWLPWMTTRAGPDRTWWAPEPGEQILLLAPSGELAQAVVLPAIYQTAHPAPGNARTLHRTEYADGTVVEYNRATSHLKINCVGPVTVEGAETLDVIHGGNVTVQTPTLVTVDAPQATFLGNVTVQGLLTFLAGMAGSGGSGATASIEGDIEVTGGDVTADGISLKNHVHPENDSGGPTGPPQ